MAQIARTDAEIARCFDVMAELRPHLDRTAFVASVREMEPAGYRLAWLEDAGSVVSVAGFRIATNLHLGRHLYLEDLVTAAPARSAGHGERMLAWLLEQAESAGCRWFELDSGVQRSGAHRFYFRHGFSIAGYRFRRALTPT
jgi:GNAT superfamily N-acetyltransferase